MVGTRTTKEIPMKVSDVISSKGSSAIYTVQPLATIEELCDRLAEHNIGALVVSENGETMIGVVSERDVVRKLRDVANPRKHTVADIMTPRAKVHTCSPDDTFDALLELMTEHRVRHVPVIENDKVVAVISIGDAVKTRTEQLEFERDQLNRYVAGG